MARLILPFLILTFFTAMGAHVTVNWIGGYMHAIAEETALQMKIRH